MSELVAYFMDIQMHNINIRISIIADGTIDLCSLFGLFLFKVAQDLCGKITWCFIKVRAILIFIQVLAFTEILLLVSHLTS